MAPPDQPLEGREGAGGSGAAQTSQAAPLRPPVTPPDLGAFNGRFEIVRLLGRGGFGVVYEGPTPSPAGTWG